MCAFEGTVRDNVSLGYHKWDERVYYRSKEVFDIARSSRKGEET
jgi:hypothetical protein